MSFIAIDDNHYINTKNIDFVGQDNINGELVMVVGIGGSKFIVPKDNVETIMNIIRNQDKEEGNWVGR
jgi:hypothetical protein